MTEELRKAIADYFEPGDFVEFIGLTTEDLILWFPEETEDVLDEILELMGAAPDVSLVEDEGD